MLRIKLHNATLIPKRPRLPGCTALGKNFFHFRRRFGFPLYANDFQHTVGNINASGET